MFWINFVQRPDLSHSASQCNTAHLSTETGFALNGPWAHSSTRNPSWSGAGGAKDASFIRHSWQPSSFKRKKEMPLQPHLLKIPKDCQIQISQILTSFQKTLILPLGSRDEVPTRDEWLWHFRPCLGWHGACPAPASPSQGASQRTGETLGRGCQARQDHPQGGLFGCIRASDLPRVPTLAGFHHQSQGTPKGRAFPLGTGAPAGGADSAPQCCGGDLGGGLGPSSPWWVGGLWQGGDLAGDGEGMIGDPEGQASVWE